MRSLLKTLSRLAFLCGSLLTLLLSAGSLQGQEHRSPARGFQAANSYALSDIETINTTNGNLMMRIPLASLPAGRGTSPGFTVNLLYNSKLWDARAGIATDGYPDETGNTRYSYEELQSGGGGWSVGLYYQLDLTSRMDLEGEYPCDGSQYIHKNAEIWKLKMTFPDGSIHEFRPTGFMDSFGDGYFRVDPNGYVRTAAAYSVEPGVYSCNYQRTLGVSTGMVYFSTDGTFMRLEVDHVNNTGDGRDNPWTLYFPDGSKVTSVRSDTTGYTQRTYDRNGSHIEVAQGSHNGYSGIKISDQLGRAIIVGDGGVHTWGVNGEHLQTTVNWREVWIHKLYNSSFGWPAPEYRQNTRLRESFGVVDNIVLPTQAGSLTYSFEYNGSAQDPGENNYTSGWGELKSVTLPTGARADYTYAMDEDLPQTRQTLDILHNSPTRKVLTYDLEYDGVTTPTTETWLYGVNYFTTPAGITSGSGSVTNPNGMSTTEYYTNGLAYRSTQSSGTVTERIWKINGYGNEYVKTELTTIPNTAGQPTLTAIKDFNYDRNGNVTRVAEYDWIPYSSIQHDAYGNVIWNGIPSGATLNRVTVNEYYNPTPDASDSGSTDPDIYMYRSAKTVKRALKSSEMRTGAGVTVSRTEFNYDNPDTTGNLTVQKSWDSTKASCTIPLTDTNSISTSAQYNQYGSPTLTKDARGFQTQYTYDAVGGYADLYLTEVRTAITTPVQRTNRMEYDFTTGLMTRTIDVDNNVAASTLYDVFGRPVLVKAAEGKPEETRAVTEYSDTERRVIVRADLKTAGDGMRVSIQHYDQLGRIRLARQLEDATTQSATDESAGIKVQSRYGYGSDGNGQYSYQIASNPYRGATSAAANAEATMGWTVTRQYASGRLQAAQTFSGAGLPAPVGANPNSTGVVTTTTDTNTTTVQDQVGKQRKSMTDALGRLITVYEAPNDTQNFNYQTSYTYDALSNLRAVTQGTAPQVQTRTFVYGSLSRLTSATNPESGTISYTYDSGGNVLTKTDARSTNTTYTYDALSRVTQRSYGSGTAVATPTVTYTYDATGVTNSKGRLTSVSSSVSSYNYTGYDALGRVIASQQVTDGRTYSMSYEYDLAGNITSQTYPTGRKVTQSFDNAGRLALISGQPSGGTPRTYTNAFTYSSHGAVESMRLGNGRWEHTSFNARLQPTEIGLGSSGSSSNLLRINYDYGTTANNGNVKRQIIAVPTIGAATGLTATQHYQYDELNRLTGAQEINGDTTTTWQSTGTLWQQMFGYDRFGNRSVNTANTTSTIIGSNPTISASTNRIMSQTGEHYEYDPAGNLTKDKGGEGFGYDGENKLVEYLGGATQIGGADYFYDGDGRRVKKAKPSETTTFVYNIGGQLVAEYTTSTPESNGTSYLTSDTLGTPRVLTKADGNIRTRHDYLPFGEELYADVANRTTDQGYEQSLATEDSTRQKFTGKERDVETGLDYFHARYYYSTQGRFTSVDALLSSGIPEVPQSWNRYAYTINNPLTYIDPTGLIWVYKDNVNGTRTFRWYDDPKGVPKGWTEYTEPYYDGADGRYHFNPNGPSGWVSLNTDQHPTSIFTLNTDPYIRKGWARGPTPEQYEAYMKSGAVEDCSWDIYGLMIPGRIGVKAGTMALTRRAAAEALDAIPQASNRRLQNVIDELFKSSDQMPGGTAGAIRHEVRTGELVGGRSHILKGEERIRNLQRVMKRENLSPADRATAQRLVHDLKGALKGK